MPEEPQFQSGALLDTRTEEAKLSDYKFEELVVSINPVNWIEKVQGAWRRFPIFNQDGSSSCVAQTLAKLLGILYYLKNQLYVHFSATHIYQRRANKPSSGMMGVDALSIGKEGVTLEELVPSQNMNDSQMDNTQIPQYKKDVGSVFKIGNYVILPVKDIDTIASVIQTTEKGVMVWFYFQSDEWTDVPEIKNPNLDLYAASTGRHSVTAVDFTMYAGEKALIIEDSWGKFAGLQGQRVIRESFFKARNFFAAYPITFKFEDQTVPPPVPPQPVPPVNPKPKYNFTKVLTFGTTDPDVKALQDILKYEGTFPKNVNSTGYYGSVTAKGVFDFQVKHQVAPLGELQSLKGHRVGSKTLAKLNQLYN